MATAPSLDIELHPVGGEPRPLENYLTTFPLAAVILDPYTHESSWLLDTAHRILQGFKDAGVRVAFVVTGAGAEQARTYLGSLLDDTRGLADPDRAFVKSLGLETLPAFVAIRQDGSLLASAEGWDPAAWRDVADALAELTSWSRPNIPAAGDPAAYAGTPALG